MKDMSPSEKLEQSVLNRTYGLLSVLPEKLTLQNVNLFKTVCEKISNITSDIFKEADALGVADSFGGWRRLFIPYWSLGGRFEIAYGEGFTWRNFLEYIVVCKCTNVIVRNNCMIPSIHFSDKDGKERFYIILVTED